MKHFKILIATMLVSSMAWAQTEENNDDSKLKQQEVGVQFSGLGSFGLTYRVGTPEAMWRFQLLNGSLGLTNGDRDSILNRSNNLTVWIGAGREIRKPIAENLELRYGVSIGYGYQRRATLFEDQNSDIFNRTTYNDHNATASLITGINYVLDDQFIFGAELTPGIQYTRTRRSVDVGDGAATPQDTINNTFRARLSNMLTLSAVYRF